MSPASLAFTPKTTDFLLAVPTGRLSGHTKSVHFISVSGTNAARHVVNVSEISAWKDNTGYGRSVDLSIVTAWIDSLETSETMELHAVTMVLTP